METSLTIDYNTQWLNCVSAIGPKVLAAMLKLEVRKESYAVFVFDLDQATR